MAVSEKDLRLIRKIFENKNDAIPTQTGDKLVNNDACVALDSWMAMFQTATSEPNKTPQSNAKSK